ncbi:MAG: protein kinase [Chloroflexi bacterium]|nr:protein kinase [Chloroflexota bacterium]
MNVCPQCGTSNRPEARFCRQCRSALPTIAPPACSHCGATLRSGVRFCKQCGQPVADGPAAAAHPTCPRCGAPVREAARFCPACRAPLAEPAGPCCPNCGTPIRTGVHFCRNCSHRLAPTSPPPSPPPPGRFGTGALLPLTILAGRYVILEKIAQGGMGAVYKAQDKRLQDKIVAVKEMSESIIARPERKRVLESFQREAELLARLAHPNLVRVSDRFQEGERHYMVMEFIEGQTLEEMLKGRSDPCPEEQVLDWAGQLCNVLFYLHSQEPKIIYRDIKPANVMLLDGSNQVKLIDFGIARFFKMGKQKDTVEFGTDGYAPPEQYGKAQTDERSDVYALGAMLHQLLTLREPITRPFHFPTVRSLNPKVSRQVDVAIAEAVDADQDKRHQSMEEMQSALVGDGAAKKQRPKKPARPAAVSGKLKPTPDWMNFGEVPAGSSARTQSLTITLPPGEQATLNTAAPWLRIHPQKINKQGEQATITLDAAHLEPGRLQLGGGGVKRWVGLHTRLLVPAEREISTHVEIVLQSGYKQRVPVSATVVPPAQRVQFRWVVTVGLILIEVAVVAIALGLLVMVILF